MEPVRKDLLCYKGQTYRQNLYFKQNGEVYPLTGITAKAEIRPRENSEVLTAELDVSVAEEEGKITLFMDAATTANLAPGFYYYDLKAVDESEEVQYWIKGKFIVTGRVTV